jgi:hypothetical protein
MNKVDKKGHFPRFIAIVLVIIVSISFGIILIEVKSDSKDGRPRNKLLRRYLISDHDDQVNHTSN